jgi:hypothetical protein
MCYAARERSGQILVRAKKRDLQLEKRPPRVVGCRRGRPTIVVVGGGVAGHSAIETLRYIWSWEAGVLVRNGGQLTPLSGLTPAISSCSVCGISCELPG